MSDSSNLSQFSMFDLFRQEVETHAGTLNRVLVNLEETPENAQHLEEAMRASHSIKGAARVVHAENAVELAHAMEDLLVAAQEHKIKLNADLIDLLLKGVDSLSEIASYDEAAATEFQTKMAGSHHALALQFHAALSPGSLNHEKHEKQENRENSAPPAIPGSPESPKNGAAVKPATENTAPAHLDDDQCNDEANQDAMIAAPAKPLPAVQTASGKELESEKENFVRVTSNNLNTLMGLAGEYLVEARWLAPFAANMQRQKKSHHEVGRLLDKLTEVVEKNGDQGAYGKMLQDLKDRFVGCRTDLADRIEAFEEYAHRTDNLSNRLYREVLSCRMRPFADGVKHLPRMVRDLARSLEKKVRFEITGKATEVDRDILQKLEAPLNHMLRNSLDHGLETPAERKQSGKPETGTLSLHAFHRAGMLSIVIEDDGRGIDISRLKKKIIEKGLASADTVARLTESELIDFLFLPGFSTATQVTEVSGRGVGLDVVRDMLAGVGGVIRVENQFGQGIRFHLQLPLTLSMIRTLMVKVGGEAYAFPLSRIERSIMVPRDEILLVEGRPYFTFNDCNIGLFEAAEVLEVMPEGEPADVVPVVVIGNKNQFYGVMVERFLGERQLVVRPNDPRLGRVQDISSTALMSDGTPVLIFDVEDFIQSINNYLSGESARRGASEISELHMGEKPLKIDNAPRILVVEDSMTVRETEKKLLAAAGYEVCTAVDGADGLQAARTGGFDLIISDIDMPRMSGLELVKLLRGDAKLAGVPVIICSYKNREKDRQMGIDAGAD
ncbi:MAG: hybrid sensor histidine kinase/response regulator, partial [Candidatus Riflebacteria bacterium]|nr:hybrid sensor histidine kinase/response regulator [Candidatus Riflebacteria bacterium]